MIGDKEEEIGVAQIFLHLFGSTIVKSITLHIFNNLSPWFNAVDSRYLRRLKQKASRPITITRIGHLESLEFVRIRDSNLMMLSFRRRKKKKKKKKKMRAEEENTNETFRGIFG